MTLCLVRDEFNNSYNILLTVQIFGHTHTLTMKNLFYKTQFKHKLMMRTYKIHVDILRER